MIRSGSLLALAATAVILSPLCAAADERVPLVVPELARSPIGERARAVECMATAIAYEAANEPLAGREAVAEVILNRLHDPAFPKTVCEVVFAGAARRTGCQFSFTCDGSMRRLLPPTVMDAARAVAAAALDGRTISRTAGATSYHADYVSPYWAPSLIRVTKIGAHIFYRRPGAYDQLRAAFPPSSDASPALIGATPAAAAPAAATSPVKPFAPWGLAIAPSSPLAR